jgi:hypothetical protein
VQCSAENILSVAQIENGLATPGMEYDSQELESAPSLPSPAPTSVIQCVNLE